MYRIPHLSWSKPRTAQLIMDGAFNTLIESDDELDKAKIRVSVEKAQLHLSVYRWPLSSSVSMRLQSPSVRHPDTYSQALSLR